MSALDDAVAKVVFDLSQLQEKSWFAVVRRAMIESQEIGRRESGAELAQLRATIAAQAEQLQEAYRLLAAVSLCACNDHKIQINTWIAANDPQAHPEEPWNPTMPYDGRKDAVPQSQEEQSA